MSFEWAGCTCLWMVGPQFAYESEIRPAEGVRSCSTLIDLGCVWLRKSIFEKYFIFRKYYFWERKMYSGVWLRRNSFYEKSIPVFGSYKHFTENGIRFLRKINSHVWFVDHFTINNNFNHLHYLNKLVTIQKYSSTST